MSNRKVKSVSFNLNDPHELEMYKYSMEFSSFSSLVKRLIQNSMGNLSVTNEKVDETTHTESPKAHQAISQEFLRQLI